MYRNVPVQGAGQAPDALKDAIVRDEFYAAGAPGDLKTQGAACSSRRCSSSAARSKRASSPGR